MIIRPVEIDDAESFLDMSKRIDDSNFMLFEPGEKTRTVEQQKEIIQNIHANKNSILFVAEIEHELVGYIEAIGSNLRRIKHSAYLVLGVLEEYQGRGIASQLFNEIFHWAKEREITRLELTVMKDNDKAFNLYRKKGFIIEGEKVHSLMINGKPVNEYYLYKLL